MAETKIEWADFTFNPWRGCTKVSAACDMCYAETMSKRNPGVLGVWGKYGTRVVAAESYWKLPLKWNREAEAQGQRKRVFCASLADVFEGNDTIPEASREAVAIARDRLFVLIQETPSLDWLLLTKRPENVNRMLVHWKLPDNVWIGTTVENQKYADIRIPELLNIPAKVRFLSVEPMLGPIDLKHCIDTNGITQNYLEEAHIGGGGTTYVRPGIDWVITGGESGGAKARPMHPDWVRSIRDQCNAAGVPFFFKQHGEWWPYPNDGRPPDAEFTDFETQRMYRVGKHKAGRVLDGRTWDEVPR